MKILARVNFGLVVFIIAIVLLTSCSSENRSIPITTSSEEAYDNFIKGLEYLENLRNNDAQRYFSEAIRLDSNFAFAYLLRAEAQMTGRPFLEDVQSAVNLIDKVTEGEKALIKSYQAASENNFEDQEKYLLEVTEMYPEDKRILARLGHFYFSQQRYDEALDYYKRSIEIDEDYPSPYNMLGYLYRYRGDYEMAEEIFKKYIELIPNDPNPYDSYAELQMKMGQYGLSIETYYKALEQDLSFYPSHLGIAYNLCMLNKHKDARDELKEMFSLVEDLGQKRQALGAIAVTYIDQGLLDKAVIVFQELYLMAEKVNDFSEMANALRNQAYLLIESGEIEKAREKYAESVELMLNADISEEIKANIKRQMLYFEGRLELKANNLERARKKAQTYYDEVKNSGNPFWNWGAHQLFGMLALAEKDYELAIDELVRSNMRNPYNLYLLARAYERANNIEKAKEFYDKAANFNSFTTNPVGYALVRNKAALSLRKLQIS